MGEAERGQVAEVSRVCSGLRLLDELCHRCGLCRGPIDSEAMLHYYAENTQTGNDSLHSEPPRTFTLVFLALHGPPILLCPSHSLTAIRGEKFPLHRSTPIS